MARDIVGIVEGVFMKRENKSVSTAVYVGKCVCQGVKTRKIMNGEGGVHGPERTHVKDDRCLLAYPCAVSASSLSAASLLRCS